jgi:quercetin dioxygenase-like cupin family protein
MALHHAASGELVDLRSLQSGLGATTRTTALVKSDSFEAIHLVVPGGGQIAPHQVPGEFTLLCMQGRVTIGLTDGVVELSSGQWVYFDGGVRHSVHAIEDSSLLLTIMLGPADER